MAGWDDGIFGNLPGPPLPGSPRRPPFPKNDKPMFPADPSDPSYGMPARIGSAMGIEASRASDWLRDKLSVIGDVGSGKASMSDPATQARVMGLSSLVSGGPLAGGAPEDALSMGVSRGPKPPKTATEIATGNVSWDAANQKWVGGKVMGQPMEGPAGYPDLYNFNDPALRETPNVPQFDLPRYDPPRGVSQRVQDLIANPDVRSKMLEGMRGGMDVGMPWYNTQPAIQGAADALGGQDAGRAAFSRLQDFMGATSPRNPVPENMRAASYYYWREKNGLPPPAIGDPTPQPYGSFAQKLHQGNVQKLSEGGEGYDMKGNPKPPSFTQGLMGNYQPVAVDSHAFKAPAMMAQDPRFLAGRVVDSDGNVIARPKDDYAAGNLTMDDALKNPSYWEGKPNPNEYPAMEQYYKGLSSDLGITPAQGQASGWVGNGPLTGLKTDDTSTWLQLWQNRINNTAMRMGKTPQQTEADFWQGKHPLLTSGGAPIGPLMQQFQQSPAGQQTYPTYDPNAWLQSGELGS